MCTRWWVELCCNVGCAIKKVHQQKADAPKNAHSSLLRHKSYAFLIQVCENRACTFTKRQKYILVNKEQNIQIYVAVIVYHTPKQISIKIYNYE